MRYKIFAIVLMSGIASNAHAGIFTDDLSRCFVSKTSDTDRTALMRWMFSAMATDPALADLSQVNQAKRDLINKTAADLYSRLIFVDCRREAIAALKNEGAHALGEAGQVLGSTAARGLLNSPQGQAELSRFGDLTDKAKWKALGAEAGIKVDDK